MNLVDILYLINVAFDCSLSLSLFLFLSLSLSPSLSLSLSLSISLYEFHSVFMFKNLLFSTWEYDIPVTCVITKPCVSIISSDTRNAISFLNLHKNILVFVI